MQALLVSGQTVELAAGVLLAADDLEADISLLTDAIEVAQRTGQYAKFCAVSYCRVMAEPVQRARRRGHRRRTGGGGGLDRGWETFYPAAASALLLAGARPRRYELSGVGSLTPAELRVATMAAAGRSNREVAQALFVTAKASNIT
jgi:DNA-binding NarL/FixJ family response regulator